MLERVRHAAAAALGAALMLLTTFSVPAARATEAPAPRAAAPLFFADRPDTAAFRASLEGELRTAQAALDRLLGVTGKRTVENTLVPYNEAALHADNAGYQSGLMESVHPDSSFRSVSEELSQAAQKFQTELSLNRGVYDAIAAVDLKGADADTRYLVEKTLRDFRLAGVDKDEATRRKIAALRDELVKIGQEFDRNIRNDSRTINVDSIVDLKGLPNDFVLAHMPGKNGKISISIEYPDRFPVMKYAESEDVRRRLQYESMNRGYPKNMAVLDRLIEKRYELARILGYKTWADCVTADKMIGTSRRATDFIDRIGKMVVDQAKVDYKEYVVQKRLEVPTATTVNVWELSYYGNLIRKSQYDFDAQSVRAYFPFEGVKQGVLDVTSRIFGVTFRRIEDAAVWDPSVEAYEIREGDRLLGRFFLDLHPRPGKFNHAAQFTIRQGCAGFQIPEAALVCNLPGGKPNDPGLMEHADVVTFFHEFGHLLHTVFGGRQRWEPLAGISTEWDFVEAPSQLLEEWCWNASSLQSFAKNYQTGEPIPADVVAKMRRADAFGRALDRSFQVALSDLSLRLYDRPPAEVNSDSVVAQASREFLPYPQMPNTHFQCGFGHLDGYSAIYYTYLWSQVIEKDLFSQFDPANLLDPTTPIRYRKAILDRGGSRPAEELIRDFLHRDFNYDAFRKYLGEESAP
ncbi:MAG TPA: M3 family metallopeptidase [Candidatus Eisenbacteria bacterium]